MSYLSLKDEPIGVEDILEFIEKLPAYFMSESIPAYQTQNIYKIVTANFNQVVHDPEKNVFVKLYHPKEISSQAVPNIYIYIYIFVD